MYFTCGDFPCASAVVPFLPIISTARRHLVYCALPLACQCSGFGAISIGGSQGGNGTVNGGTDPGSTTTSGSTGGTSTPPEFNYFSFTTTATQGVISGDTISVRVPAATSLTNLVAHFQTSNGTVLVGAAQQTTRVTANNFTGPVVYTLTGTNGATRSYTVTATQTASDVFAPTISSVTATPAAVSTFPATVTVRVNYTETGSGYSSGTFSLCSPTRLANTVGGISISTFGLTNAGAYMQGTVTLQNYHEAGTWKACNVSLWDAAGNMRSLEAYSFYSTTYYYSDSAVTNVPIGGAVVKN